MAFEVEEKLGGSLRYTEEICPDTEGRGSHRKCCIWEGSGVEPVSSARLFSFRIRFGAVAVDAEGYGGVQTLPEHRGKGHALRMLERSSSGAASRVSALFLYGIEKLYPKVGFVSCLPQATLSVRVSRAESGAAEGHEIARVAPQDLPAMAALYNAENRTRPWTVVRGTELGARLATGTVWRPGPEVLVARRNGEVRGFAVVAGAGYGHAPRATSVLEAIAADDAAARAVLGAVSRGSWERRIDTFSISEPADGTVGITARRLGCEVHVTHQPDGGGMGRIVDRPSLLAKLAPELARREACVDAGACLGSAEGRVLSGASGETFRALRAGALVPDDGALLRLLVGFWSWRDAEQNGVPLPEEHRRALARWFPGPSPQLPAPHSHTLDHY
jgi:hypothetical protein